MSDQYVINRSGERKAVSFDKILKRIKALTKGLDDIVDPVLLSQRVISSFENGMHTSKIDALSAELSASLASEHPDYLKLAARIVVSNLHANTSDNFLEVMEILHGHKGKNGENMQLISDEVFEVAKKYSKKIQAAIDYDRDFNFDYFGFRTLEKGRYLTWVGNKVVERPQVMYMRVAIGIHGDNLDEVLHTYDLLSKGLMTHATPTMFNSGTLRPQMSSCFLLTVTDDSISGIYDTISRCAEISKSAGGIGISASNVRANGSYIYGSNGVSEGLVPMLKVFNETARYVNQGGKRAGAFAIYLEPWHSDIVSFLDMKKNHGDNNARARDLFYALWIPDLFMKRVENNEMWTLMCPNECKALFDLHGEAFEKLYEKYEKEGHGRSQIPARELWTKIIDSQIETGTPYMLYKDHANKKSNQQNLGTIRSSNLCTEIIEYSSKDEVAVCNLASIALPRFVDEKNKKFDYQMLYDVARKVTRNLNSIIDRNYYPIPQAEKSNLAHRPIGIGVQGLADVFIKMRLPFTSHDAKEINKKIFETIYFGALTESNEIAKKEGPYSSYKGSPISEGKFQYELWGLKDEDLSGMWDWKELRKNVLKHGVRNSLLLAPMPTASTAQILGNVEAFEPLNSNLYVRRVITGEYIVPYVPLYRDLIELGIWDEEMRQELMENNGSIQNIKRIPEGLKELYKTAYEMKMRDIIDMAADRGAFIDQSQSLNLFVAEPTYQKITSMHFYAWKKGLKTGMYYLRSKPIAQAVKFTVRKPKLKVIKEEGGEEAFEDVLEKRLEGQGETVAEGQASLLKSESVKASAVAQTVGVKEKNADSLMGKLNRDLDDDTPKNVCISCGS